MIILADLKLARLRSDEMDSLFHHELQPANLDLCQYRETGYGALVHSPASGNGGGPANGGDGDLRLPAYFPRFLHLC